MSDDNLVNSPIAEGDPPRGSTASFPLAPLSWFQLRLWLLYQRHPEDLGYNVPVLLDLQGPLHERALERALESIVHRHEILRTVYQAGPDGEGLQCVHPPRPVQLRAVPCSSQDLPHQVASLVGHLFDLEKGPVWVARLLRLEAERHVLMLNVHHIATDGWSMNGNFLRELEMGYQSYCRDTPPNLAPLALQYRDFARAQRLEETGPDLAYFLKTLSGYEDGLDLPTDYQRTSSSGRTCSRFTYAYDADFSLALERFSRAHHSTLFLSLLAGLVLTVSRMTHRTDLCLGTTTSGRTTVELEPLIGFFINIVPLRFVVDESCSVQNFMRQVRSVTLGALDHQRVPFEQILQGGGFSSPDEKNPLVPVIIRHQNFPRADIQAALPGGLRFGPYTGPASERDAEGARATTLRARCEVELSYAGTGSDLEVRVEYASDLYSQESLTALLQRHEHVLRQMFDRPELALHALELPTPAERKRLVEHDGASERPLRDTRIFSDRFFDLASRHPDALCCVDSTGSFDFATIERRTRRLARDLQRKGIGSGALVGVCMKRDASVLVTLLALFQVGAAYVPLDPSYPTEYLAQILDDARPVLVLSTHDQPLPPGFPQWNVAQSLERDDEPLETPRPSPSGLEDLAYVMYTSGSTGQPKGVRVPHRQLLNWFEGLIESWPFSPGEVVAQKTTLAFAPSVKELFAGLLQGCPLVFLPSEVVVDPTRLIQALSVHRVSRMNLVPSHLKSLLDSLTLAGERLPDLRIVVVAGEPLTAELVQRTKKILPHVRLLNNYGCTELNDISYFDTSSFEETGAFEGTGAFEKTSAFVPIGKAIQNTHLYILDRQKRLVPDGVPGELHVTGASLSLGYHQLDALTRERYVENPFGGSPLLFNTKDVVRRLPDGNLDYLGRWDFQIKVRGHRVDVRHVENVMGAFEGIGPLAVVGEGEQLLAFYVPTADRRLDERALRAFLKSRLPSYLVPNRFIALSQLPRLPNGKLDRRALRSPEKTLSVPSAGAQTRSATQRELSLIWADVLEMSSELIGSDAHFFDLGGHSLSATRVMARIKDALRADVTLSEIFDHPVLSDLSELVHARVPPGRFLDDDSPVPQSHGAHSPDPDSHAARSPAPDSHAARSAALDPREDSSFSSTAKLLDGKVALVTGASRGIGRAVAQLLARSGARVAINYRDSELRALEVRDQILRAGGRAEVYRADVTRRDDVASMVERIVRDLGPIDVLIANASISFRKKTFLEYDFRDLEEKVSQELSAVFYPCQAVVPGMLERGGGSIVAVSSGLSKSATPGFLAQSTAKAALDSFVRSLAVELGPQGIRVNTLAPGVTLTDAAAHMPQSHKDHTSDRTPLGRNGTAEDMAGAIVFLASDLSRFMTGTYLPVDGGFTML